MGQQSSGALGSSVVSVMLADLPRTSPLLAGLASDIVAGGRHQTALSSGGADPEAGSYDPLGPSASPPTSPPSVASSSQRVLFVACVPSGGGGGAAAPVDPDRFHKMAAASELGDGGLVEALQKVWALLQSTDMEQAFCEEEEGDGIQPQKQEEAATRQETGEFICKEFINTLNYL